MKHLTAEQKAHVERIYFDPNDEFEGWPVHLLKTTEELHYFATLWNWDSYADDIFSVIRNPLCDKGTALHIYWLSDPVDFFEEHASVDEISEDCAYERGYFNLISEIQERVANGFYTNETIAVDPQEIAVGDLRSDKLKKPIPEIMYQPSRGEPFPQ